jgi:hypothetical protein
MPFKDIIFGDFAPDRGGLPYPKEPGYLIQANNVRPTTSGYRPMAIDEEVASTTTLPVTPNNAVGFSRSTNARHYAGGSTTLYESSDLGATWNDNSRGGYTLTGYWDFALFNTFVIAVNGVDAPQSKLMTDAVTTNFDDLDGNPPVASLVARIRDHVVLGALSGDSYSLRWSAYNNPESWPTPGTAQALANQAGYKTMPNELGVVTQIVGGEKFGLVFQLSGITRMTYLGGDIVWQMDTFERSRGTGFHGSATFVNNWCYYANPLGFFRTDGHVVENLSTGKIEDAIVRDFLSLTEAVTAFGYKVAYDARTSTVMWGTAAQYVLCYHIPYERFSILSLASAPSNATLYSVRNSASNESAIELPYAFNSTPRLVSFTDQTSVGVTVRTGYFELVNGIAMITGLEPLGKGTSVTLASKSIMSLASADLSTSGYTSASSPNRSHEYRIRQTGRYHSLKLTDTSAASDLYQGVRVHYESASRL